MLNNHGLKATTISDYRKTEPELRTLAQASHARILKSASGDVQRMQLNCEMNREKVVDEAAQNVSLCYQRQFKAS